MSTYLMLACITVKNTPNVSAERAATALLALLPLVEDEFFAYAFFFSLR